MGTYTKGSQPLTVIRGRPWTVPMTWQSPATPPVPIDITSFTFAAKLTWRGGEVVMGAVVTDALNGKFKLTLSDTDTENAKAGTQNVLRLTITQPDGDTRDFDIPVSGVDV